MEEQARFAFGRFIGEQRDAFTGVVVGDMVYLVSDLAPAFHRDVTLAQMLDDWDNGLTAVRNAVASIGTGVGGTPLADLKPLAPLPTPRQIFCTGANYGRHVVEMVVLMGVGAETDGMDDIERRRFGESYVARQRAEAAPYVFMKPVTAVAGPCDPLTLPHYSQNADWEIELGVVIGKPTYRVSRAEALSHIAGYMVVNDVTARDKVRRTDPGAIGPDWIAAKGAPGFLPSGPYLVPAECVRDPHDLGMRLIVNGELMQDDRTSDMTFDIARQIEAISATTLMLPGDILCTGSPAGNGIVRGIFLKDGDVMEAEIEGLGRQMVHCIGTVN